jgi:hypothetical protein
MDLDIPGNSTAGSRADTMINGLCLRPWDPFRPLEVLDLISFTYDSKIGRLVQERVKKVPVTKGAPISVVTQVLITGDVKEDLVETTRDGFGFIDATIDNIHRLCDRTKRKR